MPPNSSTPKEPSGVVPPDTPASFYSKDAAIAYWDNFIYSAETSHNPVESHVAPPPVVYDPMEFDESGAPPCSSNSLNRVSIPASSPIREARRHRYRGGRRAAGVAVDSPRRTEPFRRLNRNPFITFSTLQNAVNTAVKQTTGKSNHNIEPELLTTPRKAEAVLSATLREDATSQLLDVDLNERNLRIEANQRYEDNLKKINEDHQKAIDELAVKMINELEEEQRMNEAQLKAMDANGDIRSGFHYAPRKELRRRNADGVTERTVPEVSHQFSAPCAPVYKAHWLNPSDIEADMAIVNQVLNSEPPIYENRHNKVILTEDKFYIDGRVHNRHSGFVTLHTIAHGDIPAFLISNNEHCLTYRSLTAGDARCISVTVDDLETGRVTITKRSVAQVEPKKSASNTALKKKKGRGRRKKLQL